MYLDGRGLRHRGRRGEVIVDDSFLLILHAGDEPGVFRLPGLPWADGYEIAVDSTNPGGAPDPMQHTVLAGADVNVGSRSVILLRVQR